MAGSLRSMVGSMHCLVVLSMLLPGCGLRGPPRLEKGVKLHDFVPVPRGQETIMVNLSRSQLDDAFRSEATRALRLVPLYRTGRGGDPFPQYRLFGVVPHGLAQLLGFRELDVVRSAAGYVCPTPAVFFAYLTSLAHSSEGEFELSRKEREIHLQIRIQ